MSLSRKQPMKRGNGPKRTSMKTKRAREDWEAANEKRGACRVCGTWENVELAHSIGKARQNVEMEGPRGGRYMFVPPDAVLPLCGPATTSSTCHGKHHAGTLELLPYMTLEEQCNAVEAAGGIYLAMKKLGGNT